MKKSSKKNVSKKSGYVSITQIVPAPGWFAVFESEKDEHEIKPLACWALFQTADGHSMICGMINEIGNGLSVAEGDGFVTYEYFMSGHSVHGHDHSHEAEPEDPN